MGVEFRMGEDHTSEVQEAVHDAVLVALDAAGLQGATLARMELQNTPSRIDTGLLRNSITWAVSGKAPKMGSYRGSDTHTQDSPSVVRRGLVGKEAPPPRSGEYTGTAPDDPEGQKAVYIGTNVEYALYVHEGTDKMAPNRFLKNALNKNKGELEKIISDVLRKSMS